MPHTRKPLNSIPTVQRIQIYTRLNDQDYNAWINHLGVTPNELMLITALLNEKYPITEICKTFRKIRRDNEMPDNHIRWIVEGIEWGIEKGAIQVRTQEIIQFTLNEN